MDDRKEEEGKGKGGGGEARTTEKERMCLHDGYSAPVLPVTMTILIRVMMPGAAGDNDDVD